MKTSKRNPARTGLPSTTPPWLPLWLLGAALATLVLVFWAYAPVLHTGFLFDDNTQRFAIPSAADPLSLWIGPVRPVLMFTYFLNSRISLSDTTSYHYVNVFIHLLSGLFIFLVIRRLLEWAGVEESSRLPFSAFGAILFVLHPLQSESVAYISGRSDALCGMFGAAAFAAFLYRPSPAISWPRTLSVLALFGAAVLTKEQGVALPALFLLTDLWWNPQPLRAVRANWKLYLTLSLGAAAGVALFWKLILGVSTGGSAGFAMKEFAWYQYLFTQFRAIFAYIFNFLLPVNLNVDWDFPISRTIFDHGAIFGLVALLALAAVALRYRRTFPLAGYGYFVFLVLLSPTSSILPIKDPIADRRAYLPLLGLILIAIHLLRRLHVDRKLLAWCAAGLLLVTAFATHARAQVWSDSVLLWQDTALKSPNKARAHFQLGFAYFERGQFSETIAEFQKAADLEPPTASLLHDWGLAYNGLHQPELALAKLRQSAALDPTVQVYTQIAKVYAEQQRWPEALDALATAETRDAAYPVTYVFRGKIYLNTNRPAEAIEQYRHALALDPNAQDAQHDLAIAQSMLRPGR